jgi:hypothetical protein
MIDSMRKLLLYMLPLAILGACSTSKYTYHFDHYDYNSGRKNAHLSITDQDIDPFTLNESSLTASASADLFVNDNPSVSLDNGPRKNDVVRTYQEMERKERKEIRQEVRKQLRQFANEQNETSRDAPEKVAEMDNDLKLAIIFGAVGLTLSLFSGINAAFWVLGVIAIVVGVVFLIRWLVRQ